MRRDLGLRVALDRSADTRAGRMAMAVIDQNFVQSR